MSKILFLVAWLAATCLVAETDKYYFSENQDQPPRIAVLTVIIGDNYAKKMSHCTQSKIDYCKKHGYDLIIERDYVDYCFNIPTIDPRNPSWHKISAVSKHLKYYDWIFQIDADAMIINEAVTLETFIDNNYDFIACVEHCNRSEYLLPMKNPRLNAGIWFVKNCPASKALLEHVWVTGDQSPQCYKNGMEQLVLRHTLSSISKGRLNIPLKWTTYPANAFNTHPRDFQNGDFIVHFFGMHKDWERRAIEVFAEKRNGTNQ